MRSNGQVVRVWRGSSEWHDLVPRLLTEHGSRRVVEIGVWRGELSERILRRCRQLDSLLLVDPWTPSVVQADGRWSVCGPGITQDEMEAALREVRRVTAPYHDQVTILRMPSIEAATQVLDSSLDAVIIDALHFKNTVMEDIEAWRPKLRLDGLWVGDDFSHYYPGVQLAVEEVFGSRFNVLGQTWWTSKEVSAC